MIRDKLKHLDETGIPDAKLHCEMCGAKCYSRASSRVDGLGNVVVRFVLPAKWKAFVIDETVGAVCPSCSEGINS